MARFYENVMEICISVFVQTFIASSTGIGKLNHARFELFCYAH